MLVRMVEHWVLKAKISGLILSSRTEIFVKIVAALDFYTTNDR